ncbi:hypothetical protein [Leisingera sp. MMG026]|uniref:hypothetical protein n=1 Tax=Leisingera sp. MMG026 TaxID=2909982 RepID=UPI001F2BDD4C|nr:hypothetical protein [Leisingera sp. MMG026]MCF6429434.1 hypothetical protein [Leisingera sp. MMG026]
MTQRAKSALSLPALGVIFISSTAAQAAVEFEVKCTFSHSISYAAAVETNLPTSTATSAMKAPAVVAEPGDGLLFEIKGTQGVRHFIRPSLGSLLAGEFITVFPDGRSVRTQNYATDEETLGVHSEQGHCEVKE